MLGCNARSHGGRKPNCEKDGRVFLSIRFCTDTVPAYMGVRSRVSLSLFSSLIGSSQRIFGGDVLPGPHMIMGWTVLQTLAKRLKLFCIRTKAAQPFLMEKKGTDLVDQEVLALAGAAPRRSPQLQRGLRLILRGSAMQESLGARAAPGGSARPGPANLSPQMCGLCRQCCDTLAHACTCLHMLALACTCKCAS